MDARWLTTSDAALYAGFHSSKSYWEFAKRNGIPKYRAGRHCRWRAEDIDDALKPRDWATYWQRKRA